MNLNKIMSVVIADEKDLVKISELQIMESAAGYYLGHSYYDVEMEGWFPWDRVSGYSMNKETAERELESYRRLGWADE